MSPALKHALIALSFFRARHQQVRRFRHPTRASNARQTVSKYGERVASARAHIRQARAAGWRGSILRAIGGGV